MMIFKPFFIILSLSGVLFITSCNSTGEETESKVFTATLTNPKDGQNNVNPGTNIRILFDDPIDTNLLDSSIQLVEKSDNDVLLDFSFVEKNETFTVIKPTQPLIPGMSYQIIFDFPFSSNKGRAIARTYAWNFSTTESSDPGAESIPTFNIVNVASGPRSGIQEKSITVIKDQTSWQQLWVSHQSTVLPIPEIPIINFDSEMIVAAFLGTRPSGGHTITVTGASMNGDILDVSVLSVSPGIGCITTQAITSPFHLVKLELFVGNINFTEIVQSRDCN